MSACRLGTEPIHRLTAEQCDKMARKAFRLHGTYFRRKDYETCQILHAIGRRILKYKDNLKSRGLK